MNLKVFIEPKKFTSFAKMAGEYFEIHTRNGKSIFVSEKAEMKSIIIPNVIFNDLKDGIIRVNSKFLSRTSGNILNIIDSESDKTTLEFLDLKENIIYSTEIPKQLGIIDSSTILSVIEHSADYKSYSLKSYKGIINIAASINTTINSLNGYLYMEHNHSFIFKRSDLPNFSTKGKLLKQILSNTSNVFFINQYIYTIMDSGVFLLITKSRVPEYSDISYIINKSKFSSVVSINSSFIKDAVPNISIEKDADLILDLPKQKLIIQNSGFKSAITTPILAVVKSKERNSENKTDEEILRELESNLSNSVVIGDTGYSDLPSLKLPKWLVSYALNTKKSKIRINNKNIILDSDGCFILIPRIDVDRKEGNNSNVCKGEDKAIKKSSSFIES